MKFLIILFFFKILFVSNLSNANSKLLYHAKDISKSSLQELNKILIKNIKFINQNKDLFYRNQMQFLGIKNKINNKKIEWSDLVFRSGSLIARQKISPLMTYYFVVHKIDLTKNLLYYSQYLEKKQSTVQIFKQFSLFNSAYADSWVDSILSKVKDKVLSVSITSGYLTSLVGGTTAALASIGVIGTTAASIATGVIPAVVLGTAGLGMAGYGIYKMIKKRKDNKCALSRYREMSLTCQKGLRSLVGYAKNLIDNKKEERPKHICNTSDLFDSSSLEKIFDPITGTACNSGLIKNLSEYKNNYQKTLKRQLSSKTLNERPSKRRRMSNSQAKSLKKKRSTSFSEKSSKRRKLSDSSEAINPTDIQNAFLFSSRYKLNPGTSLINGYIPQINNTNNKNFVIPDKEHMNHNLSFLPESRKLYKKMFLTDKDTYETETNSNGFQMITGGSYKRCLKDHRNVPNYSIQNYNKEFTNGDITQKCSHEEDYTAMYLGNKNAAQESGRLQGGPQEEICKFLVPQIKGCSENIDNFIQKILPCLKKNKGPESTSLLSRISLMRK